MYCVKCKKKTETLNMIEVTTKNSKSVIKGVCSFCGSRKSSFTKKEKHGYGIGDKIIETIGRIGELHLPTEKGEYVPNGSFNNLQKYSYCGPGTRYEQRVREGYKGINELDSMCKLHDQFYNNNTDTPSRNISDIALAHRAYEIANNPMYDAVQRKDANFIAGIMKNKARFGLGMKSKNLKKGSMKRE